MTKGDAKVSAVLGIVGVRVERAVARMGRQLGMNYTEEKKHTHTQQQIFLPSTLTLLMHNLCCVCEFATCSSVLDSLCNGSLRIAKVSQLTVHFAGLGAFIAVLAVGFSPLLEHSENLDQLRFI